MPHNDESLADPSEKNKDQALADPEGFNFEDWLNGIKPIHFQYTLFGQKFVLRARNTEWRESYEKQSKKWDPEDQDAGFLAAHIAEPEITLEQAKAIRQRCRDTDREGDLAALNGLLIRIDTQPVDRIDARFLLGASD